MSRDPDSPPDDRRLPRRATDRVEDVVACLLMVAAFALLVVAWSSGAAVYRTSLMTANTMTQTQAVLLEDAVVVPFGDPAEHVTARVEARWVDRTGVERTGGIRVTESARAGTSVPLWLGPNGTVTTTPPGPEKAMTAGIVTGAGLVFAGAALLVGVWAGVRFLTAASNSRRWERGWARVGPKWSGRLL